MFIKWSIVYLVTFLCCTLPAFAAPSHSELVSAAREQIGMTVYYDPAYVRLSYPDGDVARDRGVCTDVIIRALRDAYAMDLQRLVHEDMKQNFSVYPKNWGLSRPDRNIDHRRVPNLQVYFKRHQVSLPVRSTDVARFLPGDIVTSMLPGNLPHIMLVSDKKSHDGTPLVIHNIGSGTREENVLFAHKITGHYRINNVLNNE